MEMAKVAPGIWAARPCFPPIRSSMKLTRSPMVSWIGWRAPEENLKKEGLALAPIFTTKDLLG